MLFKNVSILVAALLASEALGSGQFIPGKITKNSKPPTPLTAASRKAAGKAQAKVVPNAYIVQLENKGSLVKRSSDLLEEFHSAAKRDAGVDYSVRKTYSSDSLFVGVSVDLHTGDIETLKGLSNVAKVWPVNIVDGPSAAIRRAAPSPGYGTVPVAGTNYSLPYFTGDLDVNRPHAMTNVDKAHAAGNKGKGVTIGIIDTGVDYRHPSLGGGFGPGFKVTSGYDFVGDEYDPWYGIPPTEDSDPLVTCPSGGHGTHVAGNCIPTS